MRQKILAGALLLVIAAGLMAGCTDRVEETLDPELELKVIEVAALGTSPAPNARNATDGKEFLYVKINITNKNEKVDHTIWNADRFTVDDNGAISVKGSFLANMDSREIDTLMIDFGQGKNFWVIFEVDKDLSMVYIRYNAGLDEPLDSELPQYSHFEGKK